ncbi:MAG: phosphoserine phosphatase SerB [Gammaproteobacteria bacterium]|nr:MAG: phosphoserine phosphatase SerB [Gammaproteobacteria bacterium]
MARVVVHAPLSKEEIEPIRRDLCAKVRQHTSHVIFDTDTSISRSIITSLRKALHTDVNCIPPSFNPDNAHLLIMDMDSTLISIECVDEIADFIGRKEAVSSITEAAMRGEIDFKTSLQERVRLLEGLDESVLQQVYDERLSLNPGAETLIRGLKERGMHVALVSGGFTFFTERLQERLDFNYTLANQLEIVNGKLTGRIIGDIVDARAKANFMHEICQKMGIEPVQVIAVGDGANDLKMMHDAGLSVAFRAKPAVQSHSDTQINICGLDVILDLVDANIP